MAPPGACHAKASSPPSNVGTPSEHPHIDCSHTASHGSNRACVEMPLEGVSECCSGARARRERRRHWYGRRRAPPGACHAKAASPPSQVGTPAEHPPSIACSGLSRDAPADAPADAPTDGANGPVEWCAFPAESSVTKHQSRSVASCTTPWTWHARCAVVTTRPPASSPKRDGQTLRCLSSHADRTAEQATR